VATDKNRIAVYVDDKLKADLEKLAKVRMRSVSNLGAALFQEAIDAAKASGLIEDTSEGGNDRTEK
jgi:CopG-like RHH_1 or ribbon-helix-helix domain, RHH_5